MKTAADFLAEAREDAYAQQWEEEHPGKSYAQAKSRMLKKNSEWLRKRLEEKEALKIGK